MAKVSGENPHAMAATAKVSWYTSTGRLQYMQVRYWWLMWYMDIGVNSRRTPNYTTLPVQYYVY
jgi:hypothetical protein